MAAVVSATPAAGDGSLGNHISRTLQLAVPVMLSRAGILLLVMVDSVMTGQAGSYQLAYYALGIAPQQLLVLIGIGLLMGIVVFTAQADGAGRQADCGAIWRVGLLHALLFGIGVMAFCFAGEQLLLWLGQSPDLARGGGRVLEIFGWSLPAMLMFIATTSFLEGINRPLPGMIIMLFANVLNAPLNWLLIYGNGGFPVLGAEGAALATTIVRWLMFFALAGYVWWSVDRDRYGISAPIADSRGLGRRLRRFGYPMALSTGFESSAFAGMTILAGLMGPLHVAAYQANLSLVSLVFMFALGFATAGSIRVANAVGRGDPRGVRRAGWTAASLALLVLGCCTLVLYSVSDRLAWLYTTEAEVAAITAAALAVAAFVLLPDGLQAVMMGVLRGMGDVWPATFAFLVAFWLVMLPTGYLLAVHRGGGTVALVNAMLLGCVIAAVLLTARFHQLSRRSA